jgi:hypothetical protein
MRILEVVLDHHESLNCKGNKNCHYTNATKEPITWFFNLRESHKRDCKHQCRRIEQTQEPRQLLIWGGNTDLHSLRPWGRGGHLHACKQRRTRAAPGMKQQEPSPLPRQRKPGDSSATSSGASSVFKHGCKQG